MCTKLSFVNYILCWEVADGKGKGRQGQGKGREQMIRDPKLGKTVPPSDHIFQLIAMETHGPLNASALNFLSEVGRRLNSVSGDSRETSFLFQRLSVIVQRFNSVLIMDSFCTTDEDPDL